MTEQTSLLWEIRFPSGKTWLVSCGECDPAEVCKAYLSMTLEDARAWGVELTMKENGDDPHEATDPQGTGAGEAAPDAPQDPREVRPVQARGQGEEGEMT